MTSRRDLLIGAGVAATAAPVMAKAQGSAPACVVSTWDFGAAANAGAFAARRAGGTAVDMVEAGARVPEADETNHSVGYGGYPDRDGHVTLDAIIMDQAGNVGAVCALEDIVHAVSVARAVMEKTPHTMLVGAGARSFAIDQGFETKNLLTPEAEAAWREWLVTADYAPRANSENTDWRSTPGSAGNHDTIGILAMDAQGRLGGACTTSGMAFKMRGRVGDSPLAGAGLWVEPDVGAATATGVGGGSGAGAGGAVTTADSGDGAGAWAGADAGGGALGASTTAGAPLPPASEYQAAPAATASTSTPAPIQTPLPEEESAMRTGPLPTGGGAGRGGGGTDTGGGTGAVAAGGGRVAAPRITVASSAGAPAGAAALGAGAGTLGSNRPDGTSGVRSSGAGAVTGHPAAVDGEGAAAVTVTSLAPQPLQNLAASRFSVLQTAHTTDIDCSPIRL